MLRLWLARHGEAVDPDACNSDYDRTLTETGRQRLRSMTQWLIQRETPPELILHSPLVRARQTAETIAEELGDGSATVRVEHALQPGIELNEFLRCLADTMAERILCVGHQPDMSRCLAEIIGGGEIQYVPGTIAGVVFPGPIARQCGRLCWLMDPRWFG